MRIITWLVTGGVVFAGPSLLQAQKKGIPKSEPGLVFQSGFEGASHVIVNANVGPGLITPHYPNDDILGKDNTLAGKNDWANDMDSSPDGGNFMLEYTGGDSTKRKARLIPEPGNSKNHVLQFWMNDSWEASEHQVKARVQADIYGIKKPFKEFYQSVRVFLHPDFNTLKNYPDKISWFTISEFWNNEWWVETEKYGFRISLGIGKPSAASSDLNFTLSAENAGQKEVWRANDTAVKVPVGRWFTMEYYYREGDSANGRFYMAITPQGGKKQVVFDVKNYTHCTYDPAPGGLSGYNPMKMYTSKEVVAFMKEQGKTLQMYWDDFKLWRNKRPE